MNFLYVTNFDYHLPRDFVAEYPSKERDGCRLLHFSLIDQSTHHLQFRNLIQILKKGDLLILNDTKVLKARLFGTTASGQTQFEVLLVRELEHGVWTCLATPAKKIRQFVKLNFPEGVTAKLYRKDATTLIIEFSKWSTDWLNRHGVIPLPPYMKRLANSGDETYYQTIYANTEGSIAAPTAELHFTERLLEDLRNNGIETACITLHIGPGTFIPIRANEINDHKMHAETYGISNETFQMMQKAKDTQQRIVAAGTTVVRALESIPYFGLSGETNLFIRPGFQFKWVDGILTNFHLPKSTLYVLMAAFVGLDRLRTIYDTAIANKYKFYSYGDAMIAV